MKKVVLLFFHVISLHLPTLVFTYNVNLVVHTPSLVFGLLMWEIMTLYTSYQITTQHIHQWQSHLLGDIYIRVAIGVWVDDGID